MEEINILDYLNMLRQRWRVVGAVTLITMLLTGIVLTLSPRVYEGETTLLFPEKQGVGLGSQLAQLSGLPMLGGIGGFSGRDVYVTVLNSRTISNTVINRLDLHRKYGLKCKELQKKITMRTPKEGSLEFVCQVPTSWLKGRVASGELGSRTAKLAADIANAYIIELRSYDRSNSLFKSRKNRIYIEGEVERTKTELATAERKLEAFQVAHPTLIPPEKSSAYAEQMANLASKQTEADIALREAESKAVSARSIWMTRGPKGVSPETLINNQTIETLRGQLAQLEVRHSTLLEDLTESHPEVVSVQQSIQKTKTRLRAEIDRAVSGETASVDPAHQEILRQLVLAEIIRDSLRAGASAFANALSKLELQSKSLPPEMMEYVRLIRSVKSSEAIYMTLLAEYAKARVTEAQDTDNFVVLDTAIAQNKPSKPKVKLTLAAAMIMGLILGVVVSTAKGVTMAKRDLTNCT